MTKLRHRKFGNTRRLPSGRWQARWEGPDGHSHTAPDTFADRDAAEVWLAAQVVGRDAGSWVDRRDGSIPFAGYAERWATTVVHLKRSTITRDRGYLERYLVPAFGARPIGDITADDVRGFIAELSDRGLKPATVEKAGQILSKILAQAVSDHRIAANPCAGIRFPRAGKPTTKALEAWQVHDLADAIDPRYRLLVLLDCWTGLRIGEVVALTIGDIDVVRRRVTVSKSMTETEGYLELGTTKTDAGVRVVPLPSWLAEELGPYLEGKHPGDIAFPAPRGGFLRLGNWRSKQWRAATRAIGEPTLRIHDMRHTAITLWLEGGTDPVTIARWAGHESVVTVLNRYAHARADATMDHLDAMGRRRGSGATITRLR